MAKGKVMHGSRAQLFIDGVVAGTFRGCSWEVVLDLQAVHILGRFTPAELAYVGVEPVSGTLTGWRVVGHGPHVAGKVPRIQDLLFADDATLSVVDRQSGKKICTLIGMRPNRYGSEVQAKDLQGQTISFLALKCDDETVINEETAGASDLPVV
jgi:hypothetical protein